MVIVMLATVINFFGISQSCDKFIWFSAEQGLVNHKLTLLQLHHWPRQDPNLLERPLSQVSVTHSAGSLTFTRIKEISLTIPYSA